MARSETDEDAHGENKEKTGVFTGGYAINPVNGERIPVWIADYVLMGYGTGAIMAVPAHDQRDFDFARKFGLPIIAGGARSRAIADCRRSEWTAAYEDKSGVMVNSGPINGMSTGEDGKACIRPPPNMCEELGVGKRRVNYRIRDWLISRQRYWGTPIPIVHTDDGEVALSPSRIAAASCRMLRIYEPSADGRIAAGRASRRLSMRRNGRRETDTMATWACSSWYYMRFADPHNDGAHL